MKAARKLSVTADVMPSKRAVIFACCCKNDLEVTLESQQFKKSEKSIFKKKYDDQTKIELKVEFTLNISTEERKTALLPTP